MFLNVGDDLAEGKLTLPLIRALEVTANSAKNDHQRLKTIINAKERSQINDVIEIVQKTGALDYCLHAATRQRDLACAALTKLDKSPHQSALSELADYVVNRAS